MEIYRSQFLSIDKNGESLVQEWSEKNLTPEIFKSELLNFSTISLEVKAKSALWLHHNFNFDIPKKLFEWIEQNINQVQYNAGMRRVAFTVSPDTQSHLSLIQSFNEVNSVFSPVYFTDVEEAKTFIKSKVDGQQLEEKVSLENIELSGSRASITLNTHVVKLPRLLDALRMIERDESIALERIEAFRKLTPREKEVMRYIALDCANSEIAERMHLSLNTVKNHRKSVIKKLDVNSLLELYRLAVAFGLVKY